MPDVEAQRRKAEDLMGEAEQKLNEPAGKCCGGGKSRGKVEEACSLYVKAGNAFKMAKEWNRAGHAFSEAAGLQLENGRKNEAGMNYVEGAKCYKKVSLMFILCQIFRLNHSVRDNFFKLHCCFSG